VIATVNDERVKALVYIAGLAPSEGEPVAQFFIATSGIPSLLNSLQMPTVSSGCRKRASCNAFAHPATAEQIALSAAVQRPIALNCIQEPAGNPAWKFKPSWFLIAEEDHDQSQNTALHGGTDGSY
jgi:hypothetical protein